MRPALLGLALLLTLAAGCSGDDGAPITVEFRGLVGDLPFACGTSYSDLGTTAATVEVADFRLYIHDVALIHGDGSRDPLTLDDDEWQSDGVALLDFEDATGACAGSPEVNTAVRGRVADASSITALELTIGVPEAKNHLDSASAPSPLNLPGMFWAWQGGYKYLRLDLLGAGGESFVFHLGATGCAGSTAEGFACAYNNRITLRLDGFDPSREAIAVDLAALLAGADLTTANDPMVDPVDGCMSGAEDPECPPLFAALGLEHGSDAVDPAAQTLFRVIDTP